MNDVNMVLCWRPKRPMSLAHMAYHSLITSTSWIVPDHGATMVLQSDTRKIDTRNPHIVHVENHIVSCSFLFPSTNSMRFQNLLHCWILRISQGEASYKLQAFPTSFCDRCFNGWYSIHRYCYWQICSINIINESWINESRQPQAWQKNHH